MAAKLKLVSSQKQSTAKAPKKKAKARGTLKKQREELLQYLYSEAEEGVSWFRSVQARYRNKNINVWRLLGDFDGAGTIASCAPRDAYLKWPSLFKSNIPTDAQLVRNRLHEMQKHLDLAQAQLELAAKAIKRKDIAGAVGAAAVAECECGWMNLGFAKEAHEGLRRHRDEESARNRARYG